MLFGKVLKHGRLWDCFKTNVVTTLPDGQRYVIIVKQNTIFKTIIYNDIVLVLSLVDSVYMHPQSGT